MKYKITLCSGLLAFGGCAFVLPQNQTPQGSFRADLEVITPVTCIYQATPFNPADLPDIAGWTIFVPRQSSDPAKRLPLNMHAQVQAAPGFPSAYHMLTIHADGTVTERDNPVKMPMRENLGRFYNVLDMLCPAAGLIPQ